MKVQIEGQPKVKIIIPVIQDIQTASGVDRAKEICSGKMPRTFFTTRGSLTGKSMLPCRKEGSKATVTGMKGPFTVEGIWPLVLPMNRTSKMTAIHRNQQQCRRERASRGGFIVSLRGKLRYSFRSFEFKTSAGRNGRNSLSNSRKLKSAANFENVYNPVACFV